MNGITVAGKLLNLHQHLIFITSRSGAFRAETVRHALDVFAIACVIPKVQLLFCERVDLPEESITYGEGIVVVF